MLATELKPEHRDLLLGCEIAGLLHDLGKLHPGFADEKLAGGAAPVPDDEAGEHRPINQDHGSILEANRAYPPAGADTWLAQLRAHDGWARVLALPKAWLHEQTVQAAGLGAPLRQHHGTKHFPDGEMTLLGDLYAFGADIRDSVLDKSVTGVTDDASLQRTGSAFVADSFGNETEPYGPATLAALWPQAGRVLPGILFGEDACTDLPRTRELLREVLEPVFRRALGETRRPTNDVTLWHHSTSTAGLFRVAAAEGVLREDFRPWQGENGLFDIGRLGRVRFRLLGIRWDWVALSAGALQPAVLVALGERRRQALAALRELLELRLPIGHCVYEDDDGAIFAVPGCFESGDAAAGEALFRGRILDALQADLLAALAPLGTGTAVRLAWSEPRLYLTDHREVLAATATGGLRERLLQIGAGRLQALWVAPARSGGQIEICPQCGLRPGSGRERSLYQSVLDPDGGEAPAGYCDECAQLTVEGRDWRQRRQMVALDFGCAPDSFNLQAMAGRRGDGNPRVVLLSLQVDAEAVLGGLPFLLQCARPLEFQKLAQKAGIRSLAQAGERLQKALDDLADGLGDRKLGADGELLRGLLGDNRWLTKSDGRAEGDLKTRARELLDGFFLRESIPADAGLVRHDGDRLALFGQRKHASPGRLARTWDDLRALWRDCAAGADALTGGQWLPISLDARGLRLIVAADDAGAVLGTCQRLVLERLARVRAGLPVHVSALAFKVKFPLYVAFDALRRLEARAGTLPADTWTLADTHQRDGLLQLGWNTGRGRVEWTVPMRSGDPAQPDLWYPHAICDSRPQGPDRIVRLDRLQAGETITLRPSTFDFAVLEGSTRRYALRYDDAGRRPHVVLGAPGRQPYLLEHLPDIAGPANRARRSGWNTSEGQGLLGEFIDRWGRWVRDVPEVLRAQGIEACRCYVDGRLRQHLPKPEQAGLRAWLLDHLEDGGLFDAFEWTGFVEKAAYQIASSLQKDRPAGVIPADSTEEPSA